MHATMSPMTEPATIPRIEPIPMPLVWLGLVEFAEGPKEPDVVVVELVVWEVVEGREVVAVVN